MKMYEVLVNLIFGQGYDVTQLTAAQNTALTVGSLALIALAFSFIGIMLYKLLIYIIHF